MPKRCPACHAPMRATIVDHYRLDPRTNKPVLYTNVRYFTCPEGCSTAYYDFRSARRMRPGRDARRQPVKVTRRRLEKPRDFNDTLLAVGMVLSFLMFAGSIALFPISLAGKAAAWLVLAGLAAWLHRLSHERLEYEPAMWPAPPEALQPAAPALARPGAEADGTGAAARPGPRAARPAAAASAAAPVTAAGEASEAAPAAAAAAAPAATAVAAPAAPKGGTIPVRIRFEGREYEIMLNEGENLLMGALDRDVQLNYSCLEGMCDTCLIKVLSGMENLSPPTREEQDMLGEEIQRGLRLACQVKVHGPVSIVQGEEE